MFTLPSTQPFCGAQNPFNAACTGLDRLARLAAENEAAIILAGASAGLAGSSVVVLRALFQAF